MPPPAASPAPTPSGPTCSDATTCLTITQLIPNSDYCKVNNLGNVTLLPVYQNTCSSTVTCKLCGRKAGVYSGCQFWTFDPGQTVGGWASPFTWCDQDGEEHWCVSGGVQNQSCLSNTH